MKLQSAMEYLMTYGWAILIISLVAVVLFEVLNPSAVATNECIFPAGFSCLNYFILSNGVLYINMLQSTTAPINITAIGCDTNSSTSNMALANPAHPHVGIYLPVNSNFTVSVQCHTAGKNYSSYPGHGFSGYVAINYTSTYTQFPNTIFGQVVTKVAK
jgi:hypothetical protein